MTIIHIAIIGWQPPCWRRCALVVFGSGVVMSPLYDWDRRLDGVVALITSDSSLSKHNKTLLLRFKRFLLVERGLSKPRVVKYLSILRVVLGWLGKSCDRAGKEDLLCLVERIDSNGFKDWTKHD